MVLVTLVVVGHSFVLLVPQSGLRAQTYDFLYYFHIPVFVLITGYLSKSFRYSRRHLLSTLSTLVIPYIVFSWLYVQFRHHVGGEALLDPIWTDPRWPMWYLVVLTFWRLLTPLFTLHWLMVPASVAISLLAGLGDWWVFDFNRVLGLLPFFVIGLHLPASGLKLPQRKGAWVVGLAILVGLWLLAGEVDRWWDFEWLYWRASYDSLGASFAEGAWIRLRLLGLALLGCFAALSLLPKRRSVLSDMGAYSLVVYLLHGFVLRYLSYQDFAGRLPDNGWLAVSVAVAVSVALAVVLAWPPLARRLNYLVDPINSLWPQRRTPRP